MERYVLAEGKEGSTLVVMGSLQMTSNVAGAAAVAVGQRWMMGDGQACPTDTQYNNVPDSGIPLEFKCWPNEILSYLIHQGSVTLAFQKRAAGLLLLIVTLNSKFSPVRTSIIQCAGMLALLQQQHGTMPCF